MRAVKTECDLNFLMILKLNEEWGSLDVASVLDSKKTCQSNSGEMGFFLRINLPRFVKVALNKNRALPDCRQDAILYA